MWNYLRQKKIWIFLVIFFILGVGLYFYKFKKRPLPPEIVTSPKVCSLLFKFDKGSSQTYSVHIEGDGFLTVEKGFLKKDKLTDNFNMDSFLVIKGIDEDKAIVRWDLYNSLLLFATIDREGMPTEEDVNSRVILSFLFPLGRRYVNQRFVRTFQGDDYKAVVESKIARMRRVGGKSLWDVESKLFFSKRSKDGYIEGRGSGSAVYWVEGGKFVTISRSLILKTNIKDADKKIGGSFRIRLVMSEKMEEKEKSK